ncbi:hypothetical protein D9M68_483830 [compost metagenome]
MISTVDFRLPFASLNSLTLTACRKNAAMLVPADEPWIPPCARVATRANISLVSRPSAAMGAAAYFAASTISAAPVVEADEAAATELARPMKPSAATLNGVAIPIRPCPAWAASRPSYAARDAAAAAAPCLPTICETRAPALISSFSRLTICAWSKGV